MEQDTLVAQQASDTISANLQADRLGFFSGSQWVGADSISQTAGVSVDLVPYRMSNDVTITVSVLLCLLVVCFMVSRSMHALCLQIKNFFRLRDRSEDFSLKSEGEVRHQFVVIILEVVVFSLLFFAYCFAETPPPFHRIAGISSLIPIGEWGALVILLVNAAIFLAYRVSKNIILYIFNWTFFDKESSRTWFEGYSLMVFLKTVLMLLLMTAFLYFNLPIEVCIFVFLVLMGVYELLVLYKTCQIFFSGVFGLLPTILYFCTLEFLPLVFLWIILTKTNEFLVN